MCCPHPEPSSHLPPHPVCLGCSRSMTLDALLYSLSLHWSSILHMVMHMFQCYSLKSSHPHLFPHSSKVCCLICVSLAALPRTLAWKIPWMEGPGRLQSMGVAKSDITEQLHFHFSLSCTGEGNGNPLQCSCLEDPRDGGAWWAAVCGVTQSQT